MKNKKSAHKSGFTLVELIVVIAILAVLAAIAIPTFNGIVREARIQALETDARSVGKGAQIIVTRAETEGKTAAFSATASFKQDALKAADIEGYYSDGEITIEVDTSRWKVTKVVLSRGNASGDWITDGSTP